MKIVIDTNVVISGVFFGGLPRKVLEAVAEKEILASASEEIIEEYNEIVQEIIDRKKGSLRKNLLDFFVMQLDIIKPVSKIDICRDPDDNKFIECAVDAGAL